MSAKKKIASFSDKASELVKRMAAFAKGALFPLNVTCDVCGAELTADTRYRICGACAEELPFVGEHICLVCGTDIANEADYCERCKKTESVFKINRSPLIYKDGAKKLILSLKYAKKTYLVDTLASMMADTYLNNDMQAEIITFVPMSESEKKARGFNQAELLALKIGEKLKLPVLPALHKIKDTSAQKELKAKERAENLKGAFACVFKEVKDRRMLLVDDVFTTGATANECASTLLKAHCRDVSVLTAAVTEQQKPLLE